MEQYVQAAIDSPLLKRVSRVREQMGLAKLPTEILTSELDPLLLYLVCEEGDSGPKPDVKAMLRDQQYWLSFEKWDTWIEWNKD